jgi:hypothetical protein
LNSDVLAAAVARLKRLDLQECFDPAIPGSKPTPTQESVFKEFGHVKRQWIVAGNQSGKSATCARIVSWVLTGTHPHWKKPLQWGNEPLLVIVAGRTGKQIEDSLLPKLISFLEEGTYKIVRIGNIVQRLELTNGNRVIFQSLENPNVARERLQSYVAHLVWVDEMPATIGIINELILRVQARNGYFLASFTPLMRNLDIQKMVEAEQLPQGKKYNFAMLDNPVYSDPQRKAEILESMATLPEAVRNTRLFGAWSTSESHVYYFDPGSMVEAPVNYSPSWRHVEASDPALQSKFGFTLWAEDPSTGIWYCVKAEYISGIYVPDAVVEEIKGRTQGYNIIRRIADPHESWYLHTASSKGIVYVTPYNKNSRKGELIKNLQTALGTSIKIAPWCTDLIDELTSCQWSDTTAGKIVNSSSYHLLDSAQYFVDCKPKWDGIQFVKPWHAELREANEVRKKSEKLAQAVRVTNRRKWVIGPRGSRKL